MIGRAVGCCAFAFGTALVGCSSDGGEPPGISGTQFSMPLALGQSAPATALVLVADDGEPSAALRAAVVGGLTPRRFATVWGTASDPAVWAPVDLRVVVVRPSQTDDPYVTAADDPELHWRADDAGDVMSFQRFRQALERWFVPSEAAAAAPALLESFAATQSLIEGSRAASGAGEQELLDALSGVALSWTLLLAAQEDASSGAPESYAVSLDAETRALSVVAPAEQPAPDAACDAGPATPRLQSWLDAQADEFSTQIWPCSGFEAFPEPLAVDPAPECLTRGPQIEETGQAACVLSIAIAPDLACPADRGWLDPLTSRGERVPRTIRVGGEERRLCEIVQLSAETLDACRTLWEWESPEPGWCWTTRREWTAGCPAGRTALALRLVGGSNLGPPGTAELTCIGESIGAE